MSAFLRLGEPRAWLLAADLLALLAFAIVIAVDGGVHSWALIVGLPPLVLGAVTSLAFLPPDGLMSKLSLVGAIGLCGLAVLAAITSFVTPLIASTVPVAYLLAAASVMKLAATRRLSDLG